MAAYSNIRARLQLLEAVGWQPTATKGLLETVGWQPTAMKPRLQLLEAVGWQPVAIKRSRLKLLGAVACSNKTGCVANT